MSCGELSNVSFKVGSSPSVTFVGFTEKAFCDHGSEVIRRKRKTHRNIIPDCPY
jgi:hypothetical protein